MEPSNVMKGEELKMAKQKGKQNTKDKDSGFLNPQIRPRKYPQYVIAELRHDSQVSFAPSGFDGPTEVKRTYDNMNRILEDFKVKRVESHFDMRANQIRLRSTAAPTSLEQPVDADFAQAGFVRIMPRSAKDAEALTKRLKRSKAVWNAVVAPEPVPAGAPTGTSTISRNFEPCQGYLHSAPNGISAMEAWIKFNARGKGITICDIEGNWNFKHEDLPTLKHIGGTLINDLGWKNHGTAVIGEMVSKPSRSGTVGISHGARMCVQSAMIGGIFNASAAIMNATKKLKKGDVILIELHAPSPLTGRYVAMQYWNDVFSAIRVAVAKGITVVEAAGNGNENFNQTIYNGSGLQKDSGAIVVGAGIPPTNHMDYFGNDWSGWGFDRYSKIGVPRSRIFFSNHGKIVNVQAWGWHVTSTGYGDAQGGANQNRWYTHRFSGTSSASPIVTGAVACIQGHALAKHGGPLDPKTVCDILIKTGTPQESGPGVPLSQHIGPQPNLLKALAKV
jgi:subtilisin family serine protease